MHKLVLLRHGESIWNKENLFTGWVDVDLSETGILEAKKAAEVLKKENYTFDFAFTSLLKRAIRTLWIVLDEMDLMWIPVQKSWRLNERFYGALQGKNKIETVKEFGEEQTKIWRRSYDIPPPQLTKDSPYYPGKDQRYRDIKESEIPLGECLKDTVKRTVPRWQNDIAPKIKEGKMVIVSSHINCLRALIKYLDNISDEEIVNLTIPTGIPLIYELDDDLNPIKHYYLGDPAEVEKAINKVVNQIKK